MTMRSKWAVVPGLIALATAAVLLSAYSGASTPQDRAPEQPIAFPHPVHVKTLGMNCLYCHYAADKSPDPGLPALGTCTGCHQPGLIGPQRPASPAGPARTSEELAKLFQYASDSIPIPWVRIHKVPDYVQFPHMRHVNAGVTCQSCHGQVQDMGRVYQAESLNMGWCVNCHVNGYSIAEGIRAAGREPTAEQLDVPRLRARYDCSVCHY
ncbi:MAG: cytochrome c3 family protein [Gemmatimonadaceae bacterium]